MVAETPKKRFCVRERRELPSLLAISYSQHTHLKETKRWKMHAIISFKGKLTFSSSYHFMRKSFLFEPLNVRTPCTCTLPSLSSNPSIRSISQNFLLQSPKGSKERGVDVPSYSLGITMGVHWLFFSTSSSIALLSLLRRSHMEREEIALRGGDNGPPLLHAQYFCRKQ